MKNQTLSAFLVVFLFALVVTSLVLTAQGFSSFESAHLQEQLEADVNRNDQNYTLERVINYEGKLQSCAEFKTIEFKNPANHKESNTVSASILKISPACDKASNDSTTHNIKEVAANKALNIVLENYKMRKIFADGALDGVPVAYEFTVESFQTTIESMPRSSQPIDLITTSVSDELSALGAPERQGWNFFQRFRKSSVSI